MHGALPHAISDRTHKGNHQNSLVADVKGFGSTPSARIRAKMYQLVAQVLRSHLDATTVLGDGSDMDLNHSDATAQGSAPKASSSLASAVFKSSWDAFKQVGW